MGGVALAKGVSAVDTVDATNIIGNVPLSNGGTEVSLVNPHANDILFFNNGTGHVDWLSMGTGISITGTVLNATGAGGSVSSVGAIGNNGITVSGSPITSSGNITFGLGDITPTSVTSDSVALGGNANVNMIFGGTKPVNILLDPVKTTQVNNSQYGIWDTSFCSTATNLTLVASLYSNQLLSIPSGITVTTLAGVAVSPNFGFSTTGAITNHYAFYFDGGTTSPNQTITNSYGIYLVEPLQGTNKYAANLGGRVTIGTTGQFDISRLGVVTAGTWQGSSISTTYTDAKVSSVSVSGSNGIGVSGSPITSSGTIALSLGAITPTSATIGGITLNTGSLGSVTIDGNFGNNLVLNDIKTHDYTATQQTGIWDLNVYNPANSLANISSFYSTPSVDIPSGKTITLVSGVYSTFDYTGLDTGTITTSSGFYFDGGTTNPHVTIGTAYGIYAAEPLHGTTKYAAKLLGRVTIGTTGQFDISRLGVVTAGIWNGTVIDGTYLNYNTTNLKVASSQLNTIQDITTVSIPQFGGLGIGVSAVDTLTVQSAFPSFGIQASGGAGRIKIACASSVNFIESGLTTTTNTAAPLVFTTMNNGTEWARFNASGEFQMSIGGRLNDVTLYLRAGTDTNHGIAWTNSFGGVTTDGPKVFGYAGGVLATRQTSDKVALRWDSSQNVIIGQGVVPTNATSGFMYIPTTFGVPIGTPTTYTGWAPMVWDSAHNGIYIYSGGVWLLA